MFGYVTIYRKGLTEAERNCYQQYYCGLCHALGEKYGVLGRMTLSFDSAFLALLYTALYEPETSVSVGRCVPHPLRRHHFAANSGVDYAVDSTILLAYYHFLDDWQDDKSQPALRMAKQLEKYLPDLQAKYPRQAGAIQQQLSALSELEQANSTDLDALCGAFGCLLGELFVIENDMWANSLYRMGQGLGGFIYLMDAYEDLEKDRKKGRFNALAHLKQQLSEEEYEARCHELLSHQMAACAEAFQYLPITKDTPEGVILHNIIYSGVWIKYTLLTAKHRQGRKRDKG